MCYSSQQTGRSENCILHTIYDKIWIRFMNNRAVGNSPYRPTHFEHFANCVTHGLWIIPSIIACLIMLQQAYSYQQQFSALVYCTALIALFTVSTTFHTLAWSGKAKNLFFFFHVGDRAIIYLFIAASYTPWLYLKDMGFLGIHMRWLVWVFALLGIMYNYMFYEKYKKLETLFYILLGICPSVSLLSMRSPGDGLQEVAFGGLIYIVGVIFFKSDGVIPFAHAIWHLFVAAGAFFHFYAISTYLMGPGPTVHPDNTLGVESAEL
ncbi:monocyte to macrophage differentiation factor-like isoform X1 [Ptychodera flava]|uniref:monocyte to macrophage differentiation factor-like isoform X1 n=1 Tax=Ptychodera flava TaxID=63121 RepID=UPI00396A5F23